MNRGARSVWSLRLFLIVPVLFAGCRQVLGIEEAILICPPEFPDCKLCRKPADCGSSTECHSWTCKDNMCIPANKAPRSKCARGVCSDDVVSECVECLEYEDCPGGQCRDRVCSRCDDGIKNGWEVDVDCGGGDPCKGCLGEPCLNADECKSGICAYNTCCNSACDHICADCGFPFKGDCTALPKYTDDPDPVCTGDLTCNGSGLCLLRSGEVCIAAIDCASGRCEQNRCRMLAGESCKFPQECANDLCVNGVCQN